MIDASTLRTIFEVLGALIAIIAFLVKGRAKEPAQENILVPSGERLVDYVRSARHDLNGAINTINLLSERHQMNTAQMQGLDGDIETLDTELRNLRDRVIRIETQVAEMNRG